MPNKPGQTMLAILLPSELHAQVKSKAALNQTSLQVAIQKVLEEWLTGGSTSVPLESGTYSIAESVENAQNIFTRAGDKHWHSLLDRILRSDQRLAIQSVLAAFEGLVRESQGASAELPAEEERDIAAEVEQILKGEETPRPGSRRTPVRARKRRRG